MTHESVFIWAFFAICERHIVQAFNKQDALFFCQLLDQICILVGAGCVFSQIFSVAKQGLGVIMLQAECVFQNVQNAGFFDVSINAVG